MSQAKENVPSFKNTEDNDEDEYWTGSKVTIFVKRVEESPIEGRMMDTGLFRWSDRECPLHFLLVMLRLMIWSIL